MSEISNQNKYPFPPDVEIKLVWNWWEALGAKIFGKKYHEFNGNYETKAYYHKGILYFTKLGKPA